MMLWWSVLCALWVSTCGAAERYHPESARGERVERGERLERVEAERDAGFWRAEAAAGLAERLKARGAGGAARGVVMFLGDGMSVPTLAAARTLLGQRHNRTGEETRLSFEAFPSVGLAKVPLAVHTRSRRGRLAIT